MTKGIEIPVGMNVREFQSGVTRVEDGFSDVADSLDDLAKGGEKAGDQLADGLKDGGRKGEAALERVEDSFREVSRASDRTGDDIRQDNQRSERSFKELADTARRESKQGFDSVSRSSKDSMRESGGAVQSFREEAVQNFAETASSFDGSMTSVADGIQGTFGGLATAIPGPIGLALAGIGALAGAAFAGMQQDMEETEQRASDMFEDMIASGQNYASTDFVNRSIQETLNDAGKFEQAQKDAAATGLDLSLILQAQAGDASALNAVLAETGPKVAEINSKIDDYKATAAPQYLRDQAVAAETLNGRYVDVAQSTDTAAKKADAYRQATRDYGAAADDASKKTDAFSQKLAALPPGRTVRLDVDDSALERALTRHQGRTIQVNVEGVITRIGNQTY